LVHLIPTENEIIPADRLAHYIHYTMAEPIPSASHAGENPEDDSANVVPNNAEDRKAAAALDALNANDMSQDNGEAGTKKRSNVDQDALDKAMSRLEIASGVNKKKEDTKKAEMKKAADIKKKIKVSVEDVNFLVYQWDSDLTLWVADWEQGYGARSYQKQGHRTSTRI
jgi:hypothetical protein